MVARYVMALPWEIVRKNWVERESSVNSLWLADYAIQYIFKGYKPTG